MRNELIAIADLLLETFGQLDKLEFFAFGSSTRPDHKPNDLDLLIVYSNPIVPERIREILQSLETIPIHSLFLTSQEEHETNFIVEQNCIAIR